MAAVAAVCDSVSFSDSWALRRFGGTMDATLKDRLCARARLWACSAVDSARSPIDSV